VLIALLIKKLNILKCELRNRFRSWVERKASEAYSKTNYGLSYQSLRLALRLLAEMRGANSLKF